MDEKNNVKGNKHVILSGDLIEFTVLNVSEVAEIVGFKLKYSLLGGYLRDIGFEYKVYNCNGRSKKGFKIRFNTEELGER